MPRLSILIPAWAPNEALENTLVSVLENRPRDCEIVVITPRPYADPYDLSDEVRFVEAANARTLAEGINSGLRACRAAIVHLLAAGAEVADNWCEPVLPHFRDPSVAAVAPLVLRSRDEPTIESAGIDYHSAGRRVELAQGRSVDQITATPRPVLGPAHLAAFYRQDALYVAGEAYCPLVGARRADIDLALRLRQAGYRALLEPACQVFRAQAQPERENSFIAALRGERLFWRHALPGARTVATIRHLLASTGEFLGMLPRPAALARLAGRMYAACEREHYRQHYAALAALATTHRSPTDRSGVVAAPHFATQRVRAARMSEHNS